MYSPGYKSFSKINFSLYLISLILKKTDLVKFIPAQVMMALQDLVMEVELQKTLLALKPLVPLMKQTLQLALY